MIEKGQMISGRYQIIKSIGEGGMANVYVGYDNILNRKVAIKILRGDLAGDEKFVRRFQREALSASSLSHNNIVEMYDVGEDQGLYYIIMEYIDGKTLKQLIKKRGSLTLSEAIDIMLQLTDGIAHAHDSYIIHRDLKPQNIMIKEDGTIKITDFGIAVAQNATALTQTNSVMGSVHYLPPEQASGKGSTIRSDIYSMGILFYELLTGTVPFKGDNAVEIALKQMHDPLPSVRRKDPSIPQSVENIIIKATAKNPKNRYSDAKEMHNDLLTCLNEERLDETRLMYKFPEHEKDEPPKEEQRKEMLKEIEEKDEETPIAVKLDEDTEKTNRKTNKLIWIITGVISFFILFALILLFVLPQLTKIPDVKVPDVSNLSVIDAERKLKEAGFNVAVETEKEENKEVEKGKVIKTSPIAGRLIKKGNTITLYESLGEEIFVLENYSGKDVEQVTSILEGVHKLKVKVEKKDLDDLTTVKQGEVIDQLPKEGAKVNEGTEIVLYVPNFLEGYPDLVEESWSLEDIEKFATKYGIVLKVEYQASQQHSEGMIISQSRAPGAPIVKGATLKVVISKSGNSVTGEPADESNLTNLLP